MQYWNPMKLHEAPLHIETSGHTRTKPSPKLYMKRVNQHPSSTTITRRPHSLPLPRPRPLPRPPEAMLSARPPTWRSADSVRPPGSSEGGSPASAFRKLATENENSSGDVCRSESGNRGKNVGRARPPDTTGRPETARPVTPVNAVSSSRISPVSPTSAGAGRWMYLYAWGSAQRTSDEVFWVLIICMGQPGKNVQWIARTSKTSEAKEASVGGSDTVD